MKHVSKFMMVSVVALTSVITCEADSSLKIIDDFSNDSRSSYMTNLKTGIFDLPEANWRLQNSRYYPAPVDRDHQWNNDSSTKRAAVLFRKKERLAPGQAIAVTIGYSDMAYKYPRFGLQIDKHSFAVVPGNAGYFLAVGGKEYDLELGLKEDREIRLTLVRGIQSKSNTIYWSARGSGIAKRGEYVMDDLLPKAVFGLVFSAGYREQQRDYYLTDLRYGTLSAQKLPGDAVADLTIRSKLPPIESNKTKLVLENEEGALTEKEMKSLVEWALNEPGQWSNHGNRALARHVDLYKVYKIYEKTKDIRILEHLVDIAEMAIESRNDVNEVIGCFKTLTGRTDEKWTYDYGPSWPHYMGWNEEDGDKLYHGDAGEDAVGVHYMALAARAIAVTPEIWSKTVEGSEKSYRETAVTFVNEAIFTVEKSIIPKFIEPGTLESIYQYQRSLPGTRTLDKGGYVPFNRFWHVPVAFVSLCPAMEILEVEMDKVQIYDRISQVCIERWLKSMDHYQKDGLDLIDYPYCYPSKNNYAAAPEQWGFMPQDFKGFPSEDLNHLGCDASQLFIFHYSPRYDVPADILERYANALIVNAPRKGQEYLAYRLDGSGRGKTKTLHTTAYFFTDYQPELKKLYWENSFQNMAELEKEALFLKFFNSL